MPNMKSIPRKAGRPALPKGAAKGSIVPVRFKLKDRKRVEAAAREHKTTVSEWIRNTLDAAMKV